MTIILRIAAFCIAMFAATAFAQTYPNRFVRIIVPFPAGGPTDVMARLIGQKLSEKLGQQFIVENIGGAGGNIGMGNAAEAAGDGYTILFVSSSYVVNPSLYHKVPYDPDKDFVPITKAAGAPNALIAHPSVPARSVQELVALIKADPARFNIASPGIGTTPHLSIELFKQAFGLDDLTVVPFGGGNPAIQAVVAGHTPLSFQAVPPATALIKEGKLHALAITAAKRSSALPEVPTLTNSAPRARKPKPCRACSRPRVRRRRSWNCCSARSPRSSRRPTSGRRCCRSASSRSATRRPSSASTSTPRSPSGAGSSRVRIFRRYERVFDHSRTSACSSAYSRKTRSLR